MLKPRADALNVAGGLIGANIVGILWFVAWGLMFREIPKANESAFLVLVGVISNSVSGVVGFYFGSSVTAKTQSEATAKAVDMAHAAQAVALPASDATVIPVAAGDSVTVKADDAPAT